MNYTASIVSSLAGANQLAGLVAHAVEAMERVIALCPPPRRIVRGVAFRRQRVREVGGERRRPLAWCATRRGCAVLVWQEGGRWCWDGYRRDGEVLRIAAQGRDAATLAVALDRAARMLGRLERGR